MCPCIYWGQPWKGSLVVPSFARHALKQCGDVLKQYTVEMWNLSSSEHTHFSKNQKWLAWKSSSKVELSSRENHQGGFSSKPCLANMLTWWLIPLSKWVITPVIIGISRVNPLISGVITHLLSGMNHQVIINQQKCRTQQMLTVVSIGHQSTAATRCT
jgi:hypothetical protein